MGKGALLAGGSQAPDPTSEVTRSRHAGMGKGALLAGGSQAPDPTLARYDSGVRRTAGNMGKGALLAGGSQAPDPARRFRGPEGGPDRRRESTRTIEGRSAVANNHRVALVLPRPGQRPGRTEMADPGRIFFPERPARCCTVASSRPARPAICNTTHRCATVTHPSGEPPIYFSGMELWAHGGAVAPVLPLLSGTGDPAAESGE
jgi:hypothetical protein